MISKTPPPVPPTTLPKTPEPDTGPPTMVPVPSIAAAMNVVVTKVHQYVRERKLLAVRTDGVLQIPLEFVGDTGMGDPSGIVKGLPGTITLLTDAGYTDGEIITWLFTAEDSLPGRPITALRENRGREVHRRAQAAGF